MDNIDFKNIKGCEIIKYEEAYTKKAKWYTVPCGVASLALLFVWLRRFINEGAASLPGWQWVLGFFFAFGLSITASYAGKYEEPERWTLRISEELSALDLLKIQEQYRLKQGNEPDIWVAIKKGR